MEAATAILSVFQRPNRKESCERSSRSGDESVISSRNETKETVQHFIKSLMLALEISDFITTNVHY